MLALVNIFKKEPSPALILAYAAAQGVFLGGISLMFETQWAGIVAQAVIGTLAVVGVTLALFASGKIRASKRATKIFLIAMVGYLVFSFINLILMWTGVNNDPWGLLGADDLRHPARPHHRRARDPDGGVLARARLRLIQQGVRNRAPKKYGWTGAFGIMVTVIWLYLEILRFLAIARD